jgi:hypothetical protein
MEPFWQEKTRESQGESEPTLHRQSEQTLVGQVQVLVYDREQQGTDSNMFKGKYGSLDVMMKRMPKESSEIASNETMLLSEIKHENGQCPSTYCYLYLIYYQSSSILIKGWDLITSTLFLNLTKPH